MDFKSGGGGTALASVAGAALAPVTGGASIPIGLLLSLLSGSLFGGIFGAQDSPRDEAIARAMEELKAAIPGLGETSFSAGEVESKIGGFKEAVDVSTDISKGAVGTSLAEGLPTAGVPRGQPSSSIFVSENAPLDAGAVSTKANLDKFGLEFIKNMDENAKNRLLQAYSALIGVSGAQPGQTPGQKGILSGLNFLDIFSTGAGNLASLFKDINFEPLTP